MRKKNEKEAPFQIGIFWSAKTVENSTEYKKEKGDKAQKLCGKEKTPVYLYVMHGPSCKKKKTAEKTAEKAKFFSDPPNFLLPIP